MFGTPYQYGGGHDGPLNTYYGLDCSGFVRKLLKYAGVDPPGDHTANDYYQYFLENGFLNTFGLGSLTFFGTTEKIHHIGFSLDGKVMMSAAGGGSHVNNILISQKLKADVKIEPIYYRVDFVCCIMPNYQLPLGT